LDSSKPSIRMPSSLNC